METNVEVYIVLMRKVKLLIELKAIETNETCKLLKNRKK